MRTALRTHDRVILVFSAPTDAGWRGRHRLSVAVG
jgi:hypothetical protein